SITSALGALMLARTAEILPPSISTSACSKSPTARSRVSTQPPLIRIARPEAVAPLGCCAWAVPPTVAATPETAATLAAAVQRNSRRDNTGREWHAPQAQSEDLAESCRFIMESSQMHAVVVSGMLALSRARCQRDGIWR